MARRQPTRAPTAPRAGARGTTSSNVAESGEESRRPSVSKPVICSEPDYEVLIDYLVEEAVKAWRKQNSP